MAKCSLCGTFVISCYPYLLLGMMFYVALRGASHLPLWNPVDRFFSQICYIMEQAWNWHSIIYSLLLELEPSVSDRQHGDVDNFCLPTGVGRAFLRHGLCFGYHCPAFCVPCSPASQRVGGLNIFLVCLFYATSNGLLLFCVFNDVT